MVGHGGSSAGSYLADPTSPIPSHCASIVATSTVRVKLNHSHCYAYSPSDIGDEIFEMKTRSLEIVHVDGDLDQLEHRTGENHISSVGITEITLRNIQLTLTVHKWPTHIVQCN